MSAVVDTFFAAVPGPSTLWTLPGSAWGVLPRLEAFVAQMNVQERRTFLRGLDLLGTRVGGLALWGRPQGFAALKSEHRDEALRSMASSLLKPVRQLYATLKQLTMVLLTTADARASGTENTSPLWEAMGFPSRDEVDPIPKSAGRGGPPAGLRITPVVTPSSGGSIRWTCDVVIVGSGAGGGVAAAVLAAAGHDVVVLDKGRLYRPQDFRWHGAPEAAEAPLAISASNDQGVQIYQGSCVGGGTVVNYTTSLPLPAQTRRDWDLKTEMDGHFSGPSFERSLQAVTAGYRVNVANSAPGPRDGVMQRGLQRLNWDCQTIARNAVGCEGGCGWCGFGCRRGAKQSTTRNWLERAHRDGARVVASAEVRRIIMRGDRAVGVDAAVLTEGGETKALRVNARAVVVAAGAIQSPALLLRSGIETRAIGRYLRLHPVSLVFGRFPGELIDPWKGPMQACLSEEHADLDGAGFGVRLETAPLHPSVFAGFAPWDDPYRFKEMLTEYRHWSFIAVLLRDRDWGSVGLDGRGNASVSYDLSGRDRRHVRAGVLRAAEVLAAAGADEVMSSTHVPVRWAPGRSLSIQAFMQGLDRAGVGLTRMPALSFHQMGSLRMGSDPTTSATDRWGGVHGKRGLYVMDASLFPSASGVNPMLTISTLAHQAATRLAEMLATTS